MAHVATIFWPYKHFSMAGDARIFWGVYVPSFQLDLAIGDRATLRHGDWWNVRVEPGVLRVGFGCVRPYKGSSWWARKNGGKGHGQTRDTPRGIKVGWVGLNTRLFHVVNRCHLSKTTDQYQFALGRVNHPLAENQRMKSGFHSVRCRVRCRCSIVRSGKRERVKRV